jgi:ATP-dependent exoDNAse (exonuclease V) beta subunit
VPTDQPARERIRNDLEHTLDVVAGAGTGKTHELVERVVRLLERTPVHDLAVITFTTAAASELQERVRERVEELARTEPGDGPYTRALAGLDDAAISTLHAFAQRILTDHPLEASLPPGFEVLDPIQESVAFEEWWQSTLDRLFDDPRSADSLLRLGALGVKTNRYRLLARILTDHYERTIRYRIEVGPVPPLDIDSLVEALDVATALRSSCIDPDDLLSKHLDELAELAERMRVLADNEVEALALLGERAKLTCSRGRQANWREDGKALVNQACDLVQRTRDAVMTAVVQPALTNVLAVLVEAVTDAGEQRRREGRLTFQDLLVIARDLVREDAGVRRALSDHYRVLLLDEFQDTDPLQIDLALRIAGLATDGEVATRWQDIRARAGALFVVGDPKQSIYRFRRADIELYGDVVDLLTEDVLALTESFRSRPGILDWVNRAIAPLMQDDGTGLQVEYAPLHAWRSPDPQHPVPVARLGGVVPKKTERVGDVRAREAVELAALARRIRDEGWRVQADLGDHDAMPLADGDPELVRPAHFADIAVLLPTRTLLPELEDAFAAADIPLRIESQSLLFATTEARDLVAILGAIDDPGDEVRLVAALRTPAFGCSDADLLDYHEAGGRWSIFRTAPEGLDPDQPVAAGLAALRRLHDGHQWETPAETVERVVRERRLHALSLAHRRPRDHWRRIRFLTDAAHAFTDAGGASLRGFVRWLDEQRDEGARVNESVVPEPDDDAVRVLTVHGSKGLEFPVVLLAGLGVGHRPRYASLYHHDTTPELRLSVTNDIKYFTPGFPARSERETAADLHEAKRLLYVATTRARDHLVVSMHHLEGTPCLAADLAAVDADTPLPWREETGAPPIPAVASPPAPSAPNGDDALDADARDAWWGARQVAIRRSEARPLIAATGIAHALRPEPEPEGDGERSEPDATEDEPEDDRPAWRRGRGATALGRAVHAVLQTADLATGTGIEGAARAQALAEGIPGREDTVVALVRSVLRAPIVRRAAEQRSWREVPVAAVVEHTTIEGFIDLLVEDGDDLIVVDYKTDTARTQAELDAAVARYEPQAAAYALALEQVLGRVVSRCVFVFARPKGDAVEREVTDLAAAVGRVRRLLRAAPAEAEKLSLF